MEDVFRPSTSLEAKVKGQCHQGQKRHFSALAATCVRFMFGQTSLASSFCSCMKYLENRLTDLRQIHTEDVGYLVPLLDEFEGQGQKSKVEVTRDKNGIVRPFRRPACVRFMSGKTSLASSY